MIFDSMRQIERGIFVTLTRIERYPASVSHSLWND